MTLLTNRYRTLLFILIAMLPFSLSFGQQGKNKTTGDEEVATIRAAFRKINTLPLKQQAFSYEAAGCAEDGKIVYFLDGKGGIAKITHSGAIGDGSWKSEYYYSEGKILFCYDVITGGPAIGPVTRTEYRIYVKDDKPVRVMENQKILQTEYKSAEAIETARKLYKAYTTRDFAAALCD